MTERPHPNGLGQDEDESPQGVLSPFEGADDLGGHDEALRLLGLPSGETMLRQRALSSDVEAAPVVLDLLARIEDALRAAARDGRAWRRRIDHLTEADRAVLLDALGTGEVTVMVSAGADGEGDVQIAEAVTPGVWIGQAADDQGVIRARWVEVADAPRALREAAEPRPRAEIALEALTPPRGTMNVMGVLSEIRAKAKAWRPGQSNHVINFTLFPMTEADSAFLAAVLGETGVRASSGGYGAARVILTGLQRVWAVQFINALGAVILDTIEIGDCPDAVLASPTDFEDSADRMAEIRGAYTA